MCVCVRCDLPVWQWCDDPVLSAGRPEQERQTAAVAARQKLVHTHQDWPDHRQDYRPAQTCIPSGSWPTVHRPLSTLAVILLYQGTGRVSRQYWLASLGPLGVITSRSIKFCLVRRPHLASGSQFFYQNFKMMKELTRRCQWWGESGAVSCTSCRPSTIWNLLVLNNKISASFTLDG